MVLDQGYTIDEISEREWKKLRLKLPGKETLSIKVTIPEQT